MTARRLALALLALAACDRAEPPAGDPLARAAAWLWRQQQPDGSWRSSNYAVLRSGQAVTPFVLHALLAVPETVCARPPGGVHRALGFIRAQIDADGAVGYAVPDVLEYPVYATSHAIQALVRAGEPQDRALVERMASWLARMQYDAGEEFTADDAVYGGWGFGAVGLPPRTPGYMDLAHTRCALEALRDAGWSEAITFEQASRFLGVVQNADGGFFFSPVVAGANKGRAGDDGFRSYATATCDGLLALRAAGAELDDPRVVAARAWLDANPGLDRPAGIPEEHPEPWDDALFFYHHAVRALAVGADVGPRLAALQRADGSFANEASVLMKEDDPVLATALAVRAFRGCH